MTENYKDLIHKIQNILNKTVDNKKDHGTTACITSHSFSWCGASGNFHTDDQYFIASTTKLFITAILLKLREENKIQLDDQISKYLSEEILNGLHILNGTEYSYDLIIKNLMAHTSGLPDYFQQKRENGKSLHDELTSGKDQSWSFEKVVEESKKTKPAFKPNQKEKALYSDTNYQLLGKIIENITNKDIESVLNAMVIEPLGLKKTYLYQDINDKRPKTMYFKSNELHIPLAMTSFGPDGGIVSTAQEMMIFIEAFFKGKLFPKNYIEELKEWNRIFFPILSGIGIHRFKLPWIFSPFKSIPEIIGHSGLSGAFAYYCPQKELYLTGTVNQINSPETSYRLMIKLIKLL